ncbi:unnamed protein product [Cyclocybe aegerita]|uniref:Uncharacterized protein n=1 Tax=Cyclocybe aegerita TaxID=1973307 RepID=A0A8S0XPQ8_CYCAE|nr:unnamed protein product [Cyclocybe aegerita]
MRRTRGRTNVKEEREGVGRTSDWRRLARRGSGSQSGEAVPSGREIAPLVYSSPILSVSPLCVHSTTWSLDVSELKLVLPDAPDLSSSSDLSPYRGLPLSRLILARPLTGPKQHVDGIPPRKLVTPQRLETFVEKLGERGLLSRTRSVSRRG